VKGRTLVIKNAGPEDITFEHSQFGVLNVTKGYQLAKELRLRAGTFKLTPDFVGYLHTAIEVSPEKVLALPLAALDTPGLAVMTPQGTALLIDGHHRAVRSYVEGRMTFPVTILPAPVFKLLLVEFQVVEGGAA
jgi:hypothetical protein